MIMPGDKKSFTLVEVLIVTFLLGVAGTIIMQTFQAGTSFMRTESVALSVQQSARTIMRQLAADIRMATVPVSAVTLSDNGDSLAIVTRSDSVNWGVAPFGNSAAVRCLTRNGANVGAYLVSLRVVPLIDSADVFLQLRGQTVTGRMVDYSLSRKVRWRNV
jgi:type II secretory pathway pseudopilin PulG